MTIVLKFKQGDSGTELSMMSGTSNGFQLAGDGWSPNVANPMYQIEPQPVFETIRLLLKAASHNGLATSMQSLHEMQRLADAYMRDTKSITPIWLHAKLDNETNERRSLVHAISVQYETSWFGNEATSLDIPVIITVVRSPYWEATTARDLPDYVPSAGAVITYDYTAAGASVGAHDIVGDVGARIRYFETYDHASDSVRSIRMGVRSAAKYGSTGLTNFVPIWEAEDGLNYTDASDTADSTASGGTRVTVQESGVDWDNGLFSTVCELTLSDVTANPEDQLGRFMWHVRAKTTSGVWEVRLHFLGGGYSGVAQVDFTNWDVFELGVGQISDINRQSLLEGDFSSADIGNFGLTIQARRTNGTGNLHIDCLELIPVDEGYIKFGADDPEPLVKIGAGSSPKNVWDCIEYYDATGYATKGILEGDTNFVLPPGDGRIYLIYVLNDITDVVTLNDADVGKYYERWLSLRGSE